jgi:hypothetical protein
VILGNVRERLILREARWGDCSSEDQCEELHALLCMIGERAGYRPKVR